MGLFDIFKKKNGYKFNTDKKSPVKVEELENFEKENNPYIDLSYFVNYIDFLTNELKKAQSYEAKHYIQYQFLLIISVTMSRIFYHNATQKIMLSRWMTRGGMYISLCLLCLKLIIFMIRLPYRIAKVVRLIRLRSRLL